MEGTIKDLVELLHEKFVFRTVFCTHSIVTMVKLCFFSSYVYLDLIPVFLNGKCTKTLSKFIDCTVKIINGSLKHLLLLRADTFNEHSFMWRKFRDRSKNEDRWWDSSNFLLLRHQRNHATISYPDGFHLVSIRNIQHC